MPTTVAGAAKRRASGFSRGPRKDQAGTPPSCSCAEIVVLPSGMSWRTASRSAVITQKQPTNGRSFSAASWKRISAPRTSVLPTLMPRISRLTRAYRRTTSAPPRCLDAVRSPTSRYPQCHVRNGDGHETGRHRCENIAARCRRADDVHRRRPADDARHGRVLRPHSSSAPSSSACRRRLPSHSSRCGHGACRAGSSDGPCKSLRSAFSCR